MSPFKMVIRTVDAKGGENAIGQRAAGSVNLGRDALA